MNTCLFSRFVWFSLLTVCLGRNAQAQTPYQETYLKTSTLAVGSAGSSFGFSVDVDGHFAVAGAPYEDSGAVGINTTYPVPLADSGAVCVFRRQGPWAPEVYLKPFNVDYGDHFGWSTAISGNTVVVGAPDEQSAVGTPYGNEVVSSGAAYVFVRNEATGTWSQQAFLKAPVATANQHFGYSVDVDGDLAVIGAPFFGDAGNMAYVFRRVGVVWTQEAILAPAASVNGKAFGAAVAISGDTVVVGAPYDSDSVYSMGSAYVFKRNPGTSTWTEQALLLPESETSQDFGSSVSISGDVLVVGAPREGSNATGVGGDPDNTTSSQSGAAFVFRRTADVWSLEAYLKASNTDPEDRFGSAVAVDDDAILVGAAFEQSSATGINGNQTLNDANRAGAVYRFTRTAGVWAGSGYLKASNTDEGDEFGGPSIDGFYTLTGGGVALDGSTAIIGAALEDSDARGVGGNQADDSATDAGGAYIFENIKAQVPVIQVESSSGTVLANGASLVNFGLAVTGGDAQREVVLRNIGTGNLSVSSFGFTGANPGDFSIIAAPVAPVAAGTTDTIRVRFAPTTIGTKTANLVITSTDPGLPNFVVRLSGLAVALEGGSGTGHFRIKQDSYIKASNTDILDEFDDAGDESFGSALAMSGNTLVVGAPKEDRSGNSVINSDVLPDDQGDEIVGYNTGAAYVFVRNPSGGNWSQQAYLKASNPSTNDLFGESVAISGDTIVIGAPGEDTNPATSDPDGAPNSGSLYVFVRDVASGTWSQQAFLKSQFPDRSSPIRTPSSYLGMGKQSALSIDGDTIAAGVSDELRTPDYVRRGVVYVFKRTSGVWAVQERLASPFTYLAVYDAWTYGGATAILGDTLVVGETGGHAISTSGNNAEGYAHVYERVENAWYLTGQLSQSDSLGPTAASGPSGAFGKIVAINGDGLRKTICVAKPRSPTHNSNVVTGTAELVNEWKEAIMVFTENSGGDWEFEAELYPVFLNGEDIDGILSISSLAVFGNTILAGFSSDSHGATGINDPLGVLESSSGRSRSDSGAVFEFERNGVDWSQKAFIKASNADPDDLFGHAVAMSGRIGVAGAPGEASNARGVGGNQFNNDIPGAGAVYVFSGLARESQIQVTRDLGATFVENGDSLAYVSVPVGRQRDFTFAVRNAGDRNLTFSPAPFTDISVAGDTGHFSLIGSVDDPTLPESSSTFTIRFQPTAPGNRALSATIFSNDPTQQNFVINLTGYAPTPTDDLDEDGIPDADEFDLEAAGFSAAQNDSVRASTITDHADVFDLYDPSDMQALLVDTPLIFRNPGTGEVTLTLGVQKSTDLLDFDPFPATAPQITVNPAGKIEFRFPSPDPRTFFRIETR